MNGRFELPSARGWIGGVVVCVVTVGLVALSALADGGMSMLGLSAAAFVPCMVAMRPARPVVRVRTPTPRLVLPAPTQVVPALRGLRVRARGSLADVPLASVLTARSRERVEQAFD